MFTRVRFAIVVALAPLLLPSCESQAERERALTEKCKKDDPCKKQGLCTGKCSPEPCRCAVASDADCAQAAPCVGQGKCSAKDGKCVVATNADCAKGTMCKSSGFCSAKDGNCIVVSDDDCKQSEMCTAQHKCAAKNGACVDAAFNPALLNPALAGDHAPEKFKVKFSTTKGDITVEVTRAWAPLGADRLFNLVKIGYYKDSAFFRVDGSEAEFGISGTPEVNTAWLEAKLHDDPPKQPNDRGMVAFSVSGPNSRWAPLLIHQKTNHDLDKVGYAPLGKVVSGMEVVDSLYKDYGEGPPNGKGPDRVKLQGGGNTYLKKSFPQLDYVTGATLL